ncbi:MAG: S9 family peptidase [Candidatus Thermoplasmatota archaeon]|nr:S9 family peptidase [Candidatus Thermoplasmatota archaeon]
MARDQKIEDFLSSRSISAVTFSRDGRMVAYTSSRVYKEKKKAVEGSVVVRDLQTGKVAGSFSESGARFSNPRFSQDSRRIAFSSSDGDDNFLHIVDLGTGTGEKIVLGSPAHGLEWMADGTILILMTDPLDKERKLRKEGGDDGYFFEEEDRYQSLYHYVPGTGFSKLTDSVQVWEFTVSGSRIAMVTSPDPQEQSWYHGSISSMEYGSRKISKLYTPEWRSVARPKFSMDGEKIAFLESLWSDRGVTSGDILVYSVESGETTNITVGSNRSFSDMSWDAQGDLHVLWSSECTSGISVFDEKSFSDVWSATGTVSPSFAPEFSLYGNSYAFAFQDSTMPQEVFMLSEGKLKKISDENAALLDCTSYPAEVVRWKSTDGLECYGVFRSAGKDKPVIVYIHGGPTSFSPITFTDRYAFLLSEGFSIFMPNYRGSTGKGREYAEANRGDMGGMDLQDILSGMDYLRDSGRTASGKWFITGGSYGGFMTSWAITQTDRFSAAVGLFGISDWVSFHGTTNIPDWDSIHYNDSQYTGKKFRKFSPLEYVSSVKTPVLLMHGKEDPSVPLGQYLQFYRALKDMGKTVRLIIFPREGHGFMERDHILMSLRETAAWFRSHL